MRRLGVSSTSASTPFFLPYVATTLMHKKPDMDALAEKWSGSGQRSEDLYKGKTDEIIKALKSWIAARNARNQANLTLLWDFFENNYDIVERRNEYGTIDDVRIAPFKAKHVKMVERVQVRELSLMHETKI